LSLKKTAAIVFIGILLYNSFGYRYLFNYLEHQNGKQLQAQLDRNEFDESSLIEIKVALNLPYQTSWTGFERIDGDIELNGKHYKYLKRKVCNDSLILLCLPDDYKEKIEKGKGEFFNLANGITQNANSHQGKANKNVLKGPVTEFQPVHNYWKLPMLPYSSNTYIISNTGAYPSLVLEAAQHPPDPFS
jgi:hypothetical protein